MDTMMNKLTGAFSKQDTTLFNVLSLIPSATHEMSRIKANGNRIGFVRDANGRWYADLPSWPLDRAHLEMVKGADDLLTELSKGENRIVLKATQHKTKPDCDPDEAVLKLLFKDTGGFSGTYQVLGNYRVNRVWLCPVINFVFMRVPKYIKFSKS